MLSEALQLKLPEVVALIGGGGKTTLLFQLGEEVPGAILTTTTRMLPDPRLWAFPDGQGKVYGPPLDELEARRAPLIVVEADGSKHLPVKIHAEHEPVLPRTTTLTVMVLGTDALGKRIAEAVHRPEIMQWNPHEEITLDHLEQAIRRMEQRARARKALVLTGKNTLELSRRFRDLHVVTTW